MMPDSAVPSRVHQGREPVNAGPCVGHRCDACRTCERGRCCRRDDPEYRLPKLGDWDGPIYGHLGVLADDGVRAECHACGRFFDHLGAHVVQAHALTAAEYKAIFGLNNSTGLVGPRLSQVQAENGRAHLAETNLVRAGKATLASWTPEQRAQMASYPRRLQFQRWLDSDDTRRALRATAQRRVAQQRARSAGGQ